jgi:hypothetical protein
MKKEEKLKIGHSKKKAKMTSNGGKSKQIRF